MGWSGAGGLDMLVPVGYAERIFDCVSEVTKEVPDLMLTAQTLLQSKVFGNALPSARPLEYRRTEWRELIKGRERPVRLIIKSLLGVPSAHMGEHDHAMWCFQFPKGSVLVVYLHRGTTVEMAARVEDEAELKEPVDFIINEVRERLKRL